MALGDLALAFHRIAHRVYEVSGLRTGSVRDQCLRASLIVERLHSAHLIGDTEGLLVVGGGAAGISAAMTASKLAVPCVLLDRTDTVMSLQRRVSSRVLDPTEYDWPHLHWKLGTFPIHAAGQNLPVQFVRERADLLAAKWQLQFHRHIKTVRPAIDLRLQHQVIRGSAAYELQRLDVSTGTWSTVAALHWDDSRVSMSSIDGTQERFGAALSCVGFGTEKLSVPGLVGEYQGLPFWADDRFEDTDLGLPNPGTIDILVSGSGDGAQQDIQRLLTRQCGLDLFAKIEQTDRRFESRVNCGLLALADDEGRRAHAWASPLKRPQSALRRWSQAYDEQCEKVWREWNQDGLVEVLAQDVLRSAVTVHLTWVVGGEVPGFSFGLNRLLTNLMLRLHAYRTSRELHGRTPRSPDGQRPVILLGQRIARVDPVAHRCVDGRQCYGLLHTVYCGEQDHLTKIGEFQIVVVRHGIDQAPLFGTAPVPEQSTPFGFPS